MTFIAGSREHDVALTGAGFVFEAMMRSAREHSPNGVASDAAAETAWACGTVFLDVWRDRASPTAPVEEQLHRRSAALVFGELFKVRVDAQHTARPAFDVLKAAAEDAWGAGDLFLASWCKLRTAETEPEQRAQQVYVAAAAGAFSAAVRTTPDPDAFPRAAETAWRSADEFLNQWRRRGEGA